MTDDPSHRLSYRFKALVVLYLSLLEKTAQVRGLAGGAIVLAKRTHKFDEVRSELRASGVPSSDLVHLPVEGPALGPRRFLGGQLSVTRNLSLLIYLLYRTRNRSAEYRSVVCLYAVFLREISKVAKRYWLVVGDLNTSQIALAAAAKRLHQPVISWQFDFLDFKRFPIAPDIAVVLNENGLSLARRRPGTGQASMAFWRPTLTRSPIRFTSLDEKPIGILLNAFTDKQVLDELLPRIRKRFANEVIVRPHPNSKLRGTALSEGARFQAVGETIRDLANDVGILFCGNTSAQLKALCLGVPVVQIDGLDPMPFDHHGYVRKGIVLGAPSLRDFSFESVCAFYSSADHESALLDLLGPQGERRKPPLTGLVSVLSPHFH